MSRAEILAEFLKGRVDVRSVDECWDWLLATDDDGYGIAWGGEGGKKKNGAHRAVYSMVFGEIPPGLCVCHRCDNPPCCNPFHLWLGTNAENTADRNAKGRQAIGDRHWTKLHPEKIKRGKESWSHLHPEKHSRGVNHYLAKLDDEKVRQIRVMLNEGVTQSEIARFFNVNPGAISLVRHKKNWAHVI